MRWTSPFIRAGDAPGLVRATRVRYPTLYIVFAGSSRSGRQARISGVGKKNPRGMTPITVTSSPSSAI